MLLKPVTSDLQVSRIGIYCLEDMSLKWITCLLFQRELHEHCKIHLTCSIWLLFIEWIQNNAVIVQYANER